MPAHRLYQLRMPQCVPGYSAASLVKVTLALDSAYSYGVSGDAFFAPFVPDRSGALTELWLCVEEFSGTWGSTDGAINVQVREDLNGNNIPGTTLVASFTVPLAGSESGWVKKSGLAVALTAGRLYTIVIGDADGSAANYVTLVQSASVGTPGAVGLGVATYTANGFATAGTGSTAPALALKVGGLVYGGALYGAIAVDSSGTYRRGTVITLEGGMRVVGASDPELLNLLNVGATFSLYGSAQAPGDTPLKSWTMPASGLSGTAPAMNTWLFDESEWYTAPAGTYRFVVAPASALTTPRKLTQLAGADAELNSLRPLGMYYTKENAGSWDDTTNVASLLAPVLLPAAGGLIVHPGMDGGLRG